MHGNCPTALSTQGWGASPQNPVLRRQHEQELACESGSRFPTVDPPDLSCQGQGTQWVWWLVTDSGVLEGGTRVQGLSQGAVFEPEALTISPDLSLLTLFDGSWSLCVCDGLPDKKWPR